MFALQSWRDQNSRHFNQGRRKLIRKKGAVSKTSSKVSALIRRLDARHWRVRANGHLSRPIDLIRASPFLSSSLVSLLSFPRLNLSHHQGLSLPSFPHLPLCLFSPFPTPFIFWNRHNFVRIWHHVLSINFRLIFISQILHSHNLFSILFKSIHTPQFHTSLIFSPLILLLLNSPLLLFLTSSPRTVLCSCPFSPFSPTFPIQHPELAQHFLSPSVLWTHLTYRPLFRPLSRHRIPQQMPSGRHQFCGRLYSTHIHMSNLCFKLLSTPSHALDILWPLLY